MSHIQQTDVIQVPYSERSAPDVSPTAARKRVQNPLRAYGEQKQRPSARDMIRFAGVIIILRVLLYYQYSTMLYNSYINIIALLLADVLTFQR